MIDATRSCKGSIRRLQSKSSKRYTRQGLLKAADKLKVKTFQNPYGDNFGEKPRVRSLKADLKALKGL